MSMDISIPQYLSDKYAQTSIVVISGHSVSVCIVTGPSVYRCVSVFVCCVVMSTSDGATFCREQWKGLHVPTQGA